MQSDSALSLVEHFKDLADPRVDKTKDHDLIDVLIIAVCCLLCAGESFNDMEDFGNAKEDFFKTFLKLRNGIPSHDTFNRVFSALDPREFLDCFLRWTQSVRQAIPQEIVALDGKAQRRAVNNPASKSAEIRDLYQTLTRLRAQEIAEKRLALAERKRTE